MTTLMAMLLFLQDQPIYPSDAEAAPPTWLTILGVLVVVVMLAAGWKVFTKAGKPGWAVIIPIYNLIVMIQIAGRPIWWIILLIIPIVSIIISIIMCVDIARRFGKGTGFALGLAFLPFIFLPILAWGDAQYQPQAA